MTVEGHQASQRRSRREAESKEAEDKQKEPTSKMDG